LRLALTGQLGLNGLTDPAVKEALDLCLECKACKSECPTNVDMARLKAEFLHQYYQKHGLPWRNRLFGNVAVLGKWGRRCAPLSNWITRNRLVRWLNETILGIDRRRVPPSFAGVQFCARLSQEGQPAHAGTLNNIVSLYPDTFVNYHEPDIGLAALRLLQGAGCGTHVAMLQSGKPLACCGRPLISNGMLDAAVRCARHNVEALYPLAEQGKPIMACEPSCLLTIKDDYPALLRGAERKKAEVVAKACLTFEECLLAQVNRSRYLSFKHRPLRIMVQPHCHQRSLVGINPTMQLLRLIPGAEVIDLDAGCCGLAGSFGYEKEHYEISRLIGEQRQFPAIRQEEPDTVIVAPGFSCRLQIEHITGRRAVHPAELLWSLVAPSDGTG
jgi:Fe-S oxidoreductase